MRYYGTTLKKHLMLSGWFRSFYEGQDDRCYHQMASENHTWTKVRHCNGVSPLSGDSLYIIDSTYFLFVSSLSLHCLLIVSTLRIVAFLKPMSRIHRVTFSTFVHLLHLLHMLYYFVYNLHLLKRGQNKNDKVLKKVETFGLLHWPLNIF